MEVEEREEYEYTAICSICGKLTEKWKVCDICGDPYCSQCKSEDEGHCNECWSCS